MLLTRYLSTDMPDWDFATDPTDALTHGIHPYPAKLMPLVAERVIAQHGTTDGSVFDPFCGSGTTLLEANMHQQHAIGYDLNPLAVMISKVKTTRIPLQRTGNAIAELEHHLSSTERPSSPPPDFRNIRYWFRPSVIADLHNIQDFIRMD